jgi:hypothetical protein
VTQLANNFEGGTDGTTITTGNSGGASGNAFDGVDIPSGAVVAFTNTQAYQGSLSVRCGSRATGGICGVHWQTSLGTLGDHYDRCFFRTDVIPSVNADIIYLLDAALTTTLASIRLLSSGKLDIRNNTGALVATSTTVLSANTWYRLEWFIHQNASTGYLTLRIYTNPAASVAGYAEEINAGGATATWGVAVCGYKAFVAGIADPNFPSSTQYLYFDALAAGNATTWNGPLVSTLAAVPNADDQTTGWTSTGANLWSTLDEAAPDDSDYITATAT